MMNILKSSALSEAKSIWKQIVFAAILGGVSLGMATALLASSAWLLSMASTRPPILTLQVAIVSVRFFGLSRGIFRYAERIVSHDAAFKLMTKLRVTLYRSFSNLNLIQIGKYSRSQALQRLTKGVETSQDFWLRLVIPWASAMIAGISGIGILSWLVPQYSIICAVAYLGLAFVLPFLGFISSAGALEESKGISEEEITELIAHACDSIEEALIFQYSDQLEGDVTQSSRKLLERSNTEAKFTGSSTALVTIVTGAMTAIAIIYAIAAFKDGSIGGINIAVISLLPMVIFDTLAPLPVAFSNYKDIKSSVLTLEEVSKLSGLNESHEKELVTFDDNVSIKLKEFKPYWNLNDSLPFDPLTISPEIGRPLMITGVSGIGKSSIVYSLAGLLPYSGSVKINGNELSEFPDSQIQEIFTIGLQRDHLFATSIFENLRIGNQEASIESIQEVLEVVELTQLVSDSPEGIHTLVGDFGRILSSGERQRLLLARLLLRKTPIFILDEPFEFLDQEQLSRIANKVFELLNDRTLVLISHLPLGLGEQVISIQARR
jgi:thiol reductant ABC exporter CydC subunit